MTLPGETLNTNNYVCECGFEMQIGVQHSNAGYYIGFFCDNCGPYSRESGYYKSYEEAEEVLKKAFFERW